MVPEVEKAEDRSQGVSPANRKDGSAGRSRPLAFPQPSKSKTPPRQRPKDKTEQSPPTASAFLGASDASAQKRPVPESGAGSAPPSPRSGKQAFLDFTGPSTSTQRADQEHLPREATATAQGPRGDGSGLKLPKPSKSKTPPKERRSSHDQQSNPTGNFFAGVPAETSSLAENQAAPESGAVSALPSPRSGKQAFLDFTGPSTSTQRADQEHLPREATATAQGPRGDGSGLKLPKPSKSKTPPKERRSSHQQSNPTGNFFAGVPAETSSLAENQAAPESGAVSALPSPRSGKQAFLDFTGPSTSTQRADEEHLPREATATAQGPRGDGSGLKLPKPSKSKTPPKERRSSHDQQSNPTGNFFGGVPAETSSSAEKQAAPESGAVSALPSPRSGKQAFLDFAGPSTSTQRADQEHLPREATATAQGPRGDGSGLKLPEPAKSKTPPKERRSSHDQKSNPTGNFFAGVPAETSSLAETQAAPESGAGSAPPSPRSGKQAFLDFTGPSTSTQRANEEHLPREATATAQGPRGDGSGLKLPKPSKSKTPPKERRSSHDQQSNPTGNFFGAVPAATSSSAEKQTAPESAAVSAPPSPRSGKQALLDFTGPSTSTQRADEEHLPREATATAQGPRGDGSGLKLPKPSKSKTSPKERRSSHDQQSNPTGNFFGGVPAETSSSAEKQAALESAEGSAPPSPRSGKQSFLDFTGPSTSTPRADQEYSPRDGSGFKLPKPSKSNTPPKERRSSHDQQSDPTGSFFGGVPAATSSSAEKQAAPESAAGAAPPSLNPVAPRPDEQHKLPSPAATSAKEQLAQTAETTAADTAPPSPRSDKQAVQDFTVHSEVTPPDEQQEVPSHAVAGAKAADTVPPSPHSDMQAVQDFTVNSTVTPEQQEVPSPAAETTATGTTPLTQVSNRQTGGGGLGHSQFDPQASVPDASSLVGVETEGRNASKQGGTIAAQETPFEVPRSDQQQEALAESRIARDAGDQALFLEASTELRRRLENCMPQCYL